ncbi:MAG: hypothetical protein WDM87_04140 [Terracidiphilus sp.]
MEGGDDGGCALSEAANLSEAAKTSAATVRVALPYHLRNLAHVEGDVLLEVNAPVTLGAVLDALENALSHAARNNSRI